MFNEIPPERKYAYARVSSKSQEENSSLKKLGSQIKIFELKLVLLQIIFKIDQFFIISLKKT